MNKQKLIEKYEEKYETIFGFPVIQLNQILEDLKKLDEPQKPVIPQFVADWIEYCKRHNFTLLGCLDPVDDFGGAMVEDFEGDVRKCLRWCKIEIDKLARAWLDGYTVEEKRYLVKIKDIEGDNCYLKRVMSKWIIAGSDDHPALDIYAHHTRKELEEAGFGAVFNGPLFEIEEVEE